MVRTRVGYSGGKKLNPTYHSLGDHTEAFQIDYDPEQISYEQLLDIFWDSHNPTRQAWSRQYKAAVFGHNKAQLELAERSKARLASDKTSRWFNQKIETEILPIERFYLAEDYHQNFWQKADIDPNSGWPSNQRYAAYRAGCGKNAQVEAIWGKDAFRGLDGHA